MPRRVQHARPATIACVDEGERRVDVMFADVAAGAAELCGAAIDEEFPEEEDGVPVWRIWTVGSLPIEGALDDAAAAEDESCAGAPAAATAGTGAGMGWEGKSDGDGERWARSLRGPAEPCSTDVARSALELYRASLMNAARCFVAAKEWAEADALASQVVGLRPTDAPAFLLRAKARMHLAWLPQARHDLLLFERLTAGDAAAAIKAEAVRSAIAARQRQSKAHGRRAIRRMLHYVDHVQTAVFGQGDGDNDDGGPGTSAAAASGAAF